MTNCCASDSLSPPVITPPAAWSDRWDIPAAVRTEAVPAATSNTQASRIRVRHPTGRGFMTLLLPMRGNSYPFEVRRNDANAITFSDPTATSWEVNTGGSADWTDANLSVLVNNFDGYTQALDLLTRAAMLLRVFHIEEAIELLATFRQQHADNEHYEDADLLYTLAKRNLIPRARQEAQEILRRHASESFSADADKFYFHVTGLRDPVLKEGNNVYADEPVLVILYERMGDPSHRDLQMLRKVEERWIPGEKRFLRKIAHTRIGDY